MSPRPVRLLSVSALALAGWTGGAAAQTSEAPIELPVLSVTAGGDAAGRSVEGYRATSSSTATRTETPIRDIPQGITVLPRQLLDDQAITSLPEAVRLSPSVNGGDNYLLNFFVRGFEAQQLLNGVPRPFGILTSRISNELSNVERIEVLKGPSSILYGSVAPGGVINRVTRRPVLDTVRNSTTLQMGSNGLFRTEFDSTGAANASRTFGYRITGAIEAGRTHRDLSEGERFFLAPSFLWQPTADTRVLTEFTIGRDNRLLDRGLPLIPSQRRIARVPRNRSLQEPTNNSLFEEYSAQISVQHNFSARLSGEVRLDYGRSREERDPIIQLGNVGADGRTVARTYSLLDNTTEFYGINAFLSGRFETGPAAHRLVAGADARVIRNLPYTNALFTAPSIDIFNPVYGNDRPGRLTSAFSTEFETRSYGLYVQNQTSLLNDRLLVLVGGRYDQYSIESTQSSDLLTAPPRFRSDRGGRFSPQVGVVVKPIPSLSLYASYSESFRAPTGSTTLAQGTFPRPETGMQYETGVKADLLDDRLSATLSVFRITKENIPTTDPNNPNFSIQVGEARSQGVEFEVTGRLAPGWNVFTGLSWTDAEVTRDTQIRRGARLPEVPRFGASLWTSYEFALPDSRQRAGLGGGVFHRSNRFFDANNIYAQGDYTLVNLAAWWRMGPVRASLNLNNLLDEYYISERTLPGPGRTVIGRLTVSF